MNGDLHTAGLFANEREANLESTIAMVEDILIELDHIVGECRTKESSSCASWKIQKGSAQTTISITEEPKDCWVRVVAIVVVLTESVDKLALFEHLLTMNAEKISGAAFALQADRVLLISERSTLDLDRSELFDLITTVRNLADEFDDAIAEEFEGTRFGSDAIP